MTFLWRAHFFLGATLTPKFGDFWNYGFFFSASKRRLRENRLRRHFDCKSFVGNPACRERKLFFCLQDQKIFPLAFFQKKCAKKMSKKWPKNKKLWWKSPTEKVVVRPFYGSETLIWGRNWDSEWACCGTQKINFVTFLAKNSQLFCQTVTKKVKNWKKVTQKPIQK